MRSFILLIVLSLSVSTLQQCPIPCASCNTSLPPPNCMTCSNGFTLYNSQCIACNITYCQACKSENVCIACLDTFVLSNSSCVCRSTYYPVYTNTTNTTTNSTTSTVSCVCGGASSNTTCFVCNIPSCLTCSNNNLCSNCISGLVPGTGGASCVSCPNSNCLSCSSSNVCGACSLGYVLASDNATCVQCSIVNCASCNVNGGCYQCNSGYELIGGGCTLCQSPCSTCYGNGTCMTCISPPYSPVVLTASQSCFTCSTPNCYSCEYSSASVCTQCISSLFTIQNGACVLVCTIPNCQTCGGSATAPTCSVCLPTYTSGSTGKCIACLGAPACLSCSSSNPEICMKCTTNGYYINTNTNACVACPSYCLSCTSATVCTQLANPSNQALVNINGVAVLAICNPGCSACMNSNPSLCTTCMNGYYLIGGNCIPCPGNCATCNSAAPTQCTGCFANYYLTTTASAATCNGCNTTCLTCLSTNVNICTSCLQGASLSSQGVCSFNCPLNCISCISSTNCTSCLSGFTVGASGLCLPCLIGCNYCSSTLIGNCLSCGSGSYLNTAVTPNSCTACQPNCLTCLSSGCTVCLQGYYISTRGCSPNCLQPCATCDLTDPKSCNTCVAGYSLSGVNCVPTTSCGASGCLVCPFKFTLDSNSNCVQCVPASSCARCQPTSPAVCTSCFNGMYLNATSQICSACSNGCAACSSLSVCQYCSSGYISSTAVAGAASIANCIPCAYPCATCLNSAGTCLTCVSNYYLNVNRCVTSFNFYFTLVLSTTLAIFNSNYASFLNSLASSVGGNQNSIILNQLVSGSVSVQGYAITLAGAGTSTSQDQFNTLNSQVAQGGNITGMQVVSSSVVTNGGSAFVDGGVDVTLILAICIPVLVAIILGIGVLIYCKKKRASDDNVTEDSRTSVRQPFQFELSNFDTTKRTEVI